MAYQDDNSGVVPFVQDDDAEKLKQLLGLAALANSPLVAPADQTGKDAPAPSDVKDSKAPDAAQPASSPFTEVDDGSKDKAVAAMLPKMEGEKATLPAVSTADLPAIPQMSPQAITAAKAPDQSGMSAGMPTMAQSDSLAPIPALNVPGETTDLSKLNDIAKPTGGSIPQMGAIPQIGAPTQSPDAQPNYQQNLNRLQNSKAGVANKHGFLGVLAKIGDIAGSVLAPGVTMMIPGTSLNHAMQVKKAQGQYNQYLTNQKQIADTADTNAQVAARNSAATALKEIGTPQKDPVTGEMKQLFANAHGDTFYKTVGKMTPDPKDLNGEFHEVPNGVLDVRKTIKDPTGADVANPNFGKTVPASMNNRTGEVQYGNAEMAPKQEKASVEEQFINEYRKSNPKASISQAVAAYAQATQKPEHDPKQMIIDPDGKVIVLRPGMTVPKGSKTVTGELTNKPTADEQKRADLVENLNENLDQLQDIVTRRPDLFGKLAGRTTKAKEFIGSDDPDIAALKGIEDRLGMVQQSSHGMRSAQHVEASANSVLNGFKNGPDAMLRAISDARKSGATFTNDAERVKSGAAATSNTPSTKTSTPTGATGKAQGSDGNWHYHDKNGNDLGVVK